MLERRTLYVNGKLSAHCVILSPVCGPPDLDEDQCKNRLSILFPSQSEK